ncbi:MAG: sensor histidine kinase, partial [Novosphingobium sp.]|nr:sensor histidine kinase [Novosphingobium sp.]
MLWRRSVFFVVAVAAIFVTIAAIVLLRVTTLAHVDAAQQAAIAAAVDTDLVGLADIYASGGREELVRRLSDRHALDRGEFEQLTAYRLEDSSGKTVAG